MNKSEIAERAARKLWLIARGFAPDDGPERLAKTIEIVQMAEFVERAIAESQAPQPEIKVHLDCPKCGYFFEGWNPPEVCPNDGTKLKSKDGNMCPKCTGSKDMPLCSDVFHSPAGVRQTDDVPAGGRMTAEQLFSLDANSIGMRKYKATIIKLMEVFAEQERQVMRNEGRNVHEQQERSASNAVTGDASVKTRPELGDGEPSPSPDWAVGDTRELKAALKEMSQLAHLAKHAMLDKMTQGGLLPLADKIGKAVERAEKLLG